MAISQQDRKTLLRLARESVAATVGRLSPPSAPPAAGALAQKRGCFVTLRNQDRLRGCIGTFSPTRPLAEQIIQMAAAAARDPRFIYEPVTADEVKDLTIGLSILSKLEPIANPLDIELGVHGIYIMRGGASGCFLPEVATETGWSKEEFLTQCCAGKAGLAPDAWRDPQTKVHVFTSERFSDQGGQS